MKRPKAGEIAVEAGAYPDGTACWRVRIGLSTVGVVRADGGGFVAGHCRTVDPTLEDAVRRLVKREAASLVRQARALEVALAAYRPEATRP